MSRILISHAEKDRKIIQNFVEMLYDIGLNEDQLFCSSLPGVGVPNDEDIFDYLKNMFDDEELYVLFMLSDNYYKSPACLNEMGAAWIKQNYYTTFLLPGFCFQEIKGAINPRRTAIKLDGEMDILKSRLNEFKDKLLKMFGKTITQTRWETIRDNFLRDIQVGTNISLKDIETYCIGDNFTNGCVITQSSENSISINIDFAKTSSELSSIVVFPRNENWVDWMNKDKKLGFDISATNGLKEIDVEFKFPRRNIKYPISVYEDLKRCTITLKDISNNKDYWKEVKEICFLVYKDKTNEKSNVKIKNLKIE